MSNTIIELRHSYVTGNVPSSLANGEIAINTYDGKLFYRGGPSNTVQTIERYEGPAGLDTEIQFNDSGVLGSSDQLTFSKTTGLLRTTNLTASNIATQTYIQFGDGTKQYTANTNSFSTINVSGQSNVVAESSSDTLILQGASGILITTDAPNNKITFSYDDGGGSIWVDEGDFGEVDESPTVTSDLGSIDEEETLTIDLGSIVVAGVFYPDQVVFPSFTVSSLPSASPAAQMIYVSDETGGAVMAFSDGTNWRRVTDRQIVS